MKVKKSLSGYNCKEADAFVEALTAEYQSKIDSLNREIESLNAEVEDYSKRIVEFEAREKAISTVLIEAEARAQQIENDYKKRAELSNGFYQEKYAQWNEKLQSCREGVQILQAATEHAFIGLRNTINEFAHWTNDPMIMPDADPELELADADTTNVKTEELSQPEVEHELTSDELQNEIILGANYDLGKAVKDLGINND